jgi:hypothetical protein
MWREDDKQKTGVELPVDCFYLGFTTAMDCLIGMIEYRIELTKESKVITPVNKTIQMIALGMLSVYGVLRLKDRIDSYFGGNITTGALKKKKYLFDELQKIFGVVVMGEWV